MIPKFRLFSEKYGIREVSSMSFCDKNIYASFGDGIKAPTRVKNPILMQNTGLKDKYGKEIFEGDILNCGYLFAGSPFEELDDYEEEKGVVKIVNCGFNVKFKNDTNLLIDIMTSCDDIEVIGNIYENKYLLEE